jgi:hypothetical protein
MAPFSFHLLSYFAFILLFVPSTYNVVFYSCQYGPRGAGHYRSEPSLCGIHNQNDADQQGAVYIAHHCWAFDRFKCLVPSRKDWFRVLLTVSLHLGLFQQCLIKQVDASHQRRLLVHLGQRICE